MYITPMMGGKIVLSLLQKGKDDTNYVCAEIADNGLKPSMPLRDIKSKGMISLGWTSTKGLLD